MLVLVFPHEVDADLFLSMAVIFHLDLDEGDPLLGFELIDVTDSLLHEELLKLRDNLIDQGIYLLPLDFHALQLMKCWHDYLLIFLICIFQHYILQFVLVPLRHLGFVRFQFLDKGEKIVLSLVLEVLAVY